MSAIVVKFDEVTRYWGIYFCHKGKVEMFPMGFPDKAEAVAYAEHVKQSAKKVLTTLSTDEMVALSERIKVILDASSKTLQTGDECPPK